MLLSGEDEIFVAALANDALELVESRARADHGEAIIAMNDGRVGGGVRFSPWRTREIVTPRFDAAGDRIQAHAVEVWIGHDQRPALERLGLAAVLGGELRRFARGIDAEDLLEHEQRADDADDRRGIRDSVGQGGQREAVGRDVRQGAERLRGGAERRGIGRGAGENAEHRGRIETRQPAGERRGHGAQEHDRCREHVQFHALLAQRREEAGAELQTDGEDKQDQPELLHEIERVMIDLLAEVPDEDAREKHACRAKPDARNFRLPSAIPSTQTNASTPMACAIGCVLWSSKSQFTP